MKRVIPVLLVLGLLLCACGPTETPTEPSTTVGTTAAPTTEAPTETTVPPTTEEPTEPPTEAPTEPPMLYSNPLNGEPMAEPYTGRLFAVTINNQTAALPHRGVNDADLYFELYVNAWTTRGLAVFSDISKVSAIGSVRSLRYPFVDLAEGYDAIVTYCNYSDEVESYLYSSGVDNIFVEGGTDTSYFFRDADRISDGYAREHTLFVEGQPLVDYAARRGYDVTREPGKDYGLSFVEDGTPVDGETAQEIVITFYLNGYSKTSTVNYDETLGKYVLSQYGEVMVDGNTGELESFENVIVIHADSYTDEDNYHIADLTDDDGDGYFACGGKIIPIKWHREEGDEPFTFTLTDGTPLSLGIGNSYIPIIPLLGTVEYQ